MRHVPRRAKVADGASVEMQGGSVSVDCADGAWPDRRESPSATRGRSTPTKSASGSATAYNHDAEVTEPAETAKSTSAPAARRLGQTCV